MKSLSFLIVALLAATPASAQDLVFDPGYTAACISAGQTNQQREACIGVSANACMADTDGGYSTVGMGGCLDRELTWWDDQLNRAYRRLMNKSKSNDAEFGGGKDGIPSIALALRDMQRTWITWRDTACDFERAQWLGGTGAGPAMLGCLMRLTGEQAIYLKYQPEQ